MGGGGVGSGGCDVVVELRALAKGFIDEPKFGSGNFFFFLICFFLSVLFVFLFSLKVKS